MHPLEIVRHRPAPPPPAPLPEAAPPFEAACLSSRDVLEVLFRRKGIVVSVFLATLLGTCGWLWIRGDSYETSAKVLIRFAREASDPRSELSQSTTRVVSAARPDINTEAELIKSYALADEVVEQLRLDQPRPPTPPPGLFARIRFEAKRLYHSVKGAAEEVEIAAGLRPRLSSREKAIVALIQGLDVESVKESSIVKVALTTPGREHAGQILATVLADYKDHRLKVDRNPAEAAFFERQASDSRQRLEEKEQALQDLKSKFDIVSLDEQIDLQLKSLSEADARARASASRIAGETATRNLLSAQLATQAPSRVTSEVTGRTRRLDFLEERQAALELQRQQLVTKYGPHSEQVADLDAQLRQAGTLASRADAPVQQSQTTAPNTTYLDLQKDLMVSSQKLHAYKAEQAKELQTVAAYERELRDLRDAQLNYTSLNRDVSLADETYRLLEKNASEARAAEALSAGGITSIDVVDPPVDPILPCGIRKTYLAGGAAAAGLILAVGLAFIMDSVDHTVHRPELVEEHLGRPVWASLETDRTIGTTTPGAKAAEQLMTLASRLARSARADGAVVVGFTAPRRGAGVSTVTARVAEVASGGLAKRTLAIEVAGAGYPLAAALTAVPPAEVAGSQHVASGQADADIRQVTPHLDLASLTIPPHAADAEAGPALFAGVVQDLPRYDLVLVDVSFSLPPQQRVALARACDMLVAVVDASATPYEVLDRFIEECRRDGIEVAGAVLNRRRFAIPGFVYRAF